jgi:hypothetical protein
VEDVVSTLAEFYEDASSVSSNTPSAALTVRLNALADMLSGMPQSKERLEGLVAVNGLRLDLGATV